MEDVKKAAIVLLSLDKELARSVLAHLPPEQKERLTLELARTDDVSQDEQNAAITEFRDAVENRTVIERGSLDLAGELLGDEATDIVDNVRRSMESVPFGFLHRAHADDVLNYISEEHSQTIALILSYLPTNLAADILSELPPDKQLDVVRRVANMEQTSPEIIREIEKSLKTRMSALFNQETEFSGGVPLVAQILNVTDRLTSKGILEGLERDSEELVEEIQRLMFVFDDIIKLDNKAIQALLKEVENSQWAMALKGSSEEIKAKVMSNLSQRAAENLREEMDYLGPVKLSDVEKVQQDIVDTIRRLEDAGEIVVANGDGEQFIS
ncbi:flagellar motor switch protein FliG [bacterium]|nr:flagellar motor switch protein FliG [bacterium]